MVYDQSLVNHLGALPTEYFDGEVFRVTPLGRDPLAFSITGGRWAPAAHDGVAVPVLYTSLAPSGALAEVVSYLTLLSPQPLSRTLKLCRLGVSTSKTLRLGRADLEDLGVDMVSYGQRDYVRTQTIGAALAFLGLDGLIAPSARWPCDTLVIYQSNHHPFTDRFEVLEEKQVSWADWAKENGFMGDGR